jgi:hypothetical protein
MMAFSITVESEQQPHQDGIDEFVQEIAEPAG